MTHTFFLTSLGAAILLTACYRQGETPQTEPEPPVDLAAPAAPADPPAPDVDLAPVQDRTESTAKRADIDWQAAQADFATRDISSDDSVTIANITEDPQVPVLLPVGPIAPASVTGGERPKVVPVADGYYASYPGGDYDMEINGTDRLVAAPGRGLTATDTDLRFEETMIGAQVSFSRYGASYIVEFTCNNARPNETCISEEEAIAAVNELLVARTR
ncbi:MAG: hypothetical protein QNI84_11840 [Henriciella sp.]|nr:hypothetical protein [Henriciella sp.]